MKNVLGYFAMFVVLLTAGCGKQAAETLEVNSAAFGRLNILPNNSALVIDANGSLAQMATTTSVRNSPTQSLRFSEDRLKSNASITGVTNSAGHAVTINNAIQLNARYVHMKGLKDKNGAKASENSILD